MSKHSAGHFAALVVITQLKINVHERFHLLYVIGEAKTAGKSWHLSAVIWH